MFQLLRSFPVSCALKTGVELDRHSKRIDDSSVRFNGEVWELGLQQKVHNWHPSRLIKGESSGVDPSSQIQAFICAVCKQNHNGATRHNEFVLHLQSKGINCCRSAAKFSHLSIVQFRRVYLFIFVSLDVY